MRPKQSCPYLGEEPGRKESDLLEFTLTFNLREVITRDRLYVEGFRTTTIGGEGGVLASCMAVVCKTIDPRVPTTMARRSTSGFQ